MQSRTGHCLLLEQLPGTQKVKPGAEARFANDQSTAGWQRSKTFTQSVLFQEDVTGFFKA
jgi:hypothetical protein